MVLSPWKVYLKSPADVQQPQQVEHPVLITPLAGRDHDVPQRFDKRFPGFLVGGQCGACGKEKGDNGHGYQNALRDEHGHRLIFSGFCLFYSTGLQTGHDLPFGE